MDSAQGHSRVEWCRIGRVARILLTNFVYRKAPNPSVFVILHHMRDCEGFIEEMIRAEGMATGAIQHHHPVGSSMIT
jgi:hypothetical protein